MLPILIRRGVLLLKRFLPGNIFCVKKWNRCLTTVEVKAGEIVKVNLGGAGRSIIAHLSNEVDWTRRDQHLTGKLIPANPDKTTIQVFRNCYELCFEKDGSFRVDDVPAGTYELYLQGFQPTENKTLASTYMMRGEYSGKELAWLIQKVVVPEMPDGRSDTPLDLGTLKLNWLDPSHPGIPVSSKRFKSEVIERFHYGTNH